LGSIVSRGEGENIPSIHPAIIELREGKCNLRCGKILKKSARPTLQLVVNRGEAWIRIGRG
jgi:hypothetical protein